MENEMPMRKRNRLEHFDYSSCGAYFITICTSERQNYFWSRLDVSVENPKDVVLSPYGKIVYEAIQKIPVIYPAISIDNYVIMPDHIHLLLVICPDDFGRPMAAPTISRVVQQLKGYITKRIGVSIWQKLFFDHVIRNRQDYEDHIKYIYENPIHWRRDELYTQNKGEDRG